MKLSVIAATALLAAGPYVPHAFAQTPAAATATAQDKTISDIIARKLAEDPALKADAVNVKVDNGVVTLTGLVANHSDKARAERLARVEGVTRVDNKLATREDTKEKAKGTAGTAVDKTKEGAKKVGEKTKEGVSKTGEVITDAWITSRISTNFIPEDLLKHSDINVDSKDHVVTLRGTVMTAAGKAKAEAIAKDVEGVKRVINNLTIGPKK